jgi:hypothetical protein
MQSEGRFGVFLVAPAVTACTLGYGAWKLSAGTALEDLLWLLPLTSGTTIAMLAGLFPEDGE